MALVRSMAGAWRRGDVATGRVAARADLGGRKSVEGRTYVDAGLGLAHQLLGGREGEGWGDDGEAAR